MLAISLTNRYCFSTVTVETGSPSNEARVCPAGMLDQLVPRHLPARRHSGPSIPTRGTSEPTPIQERGHKISTCPLHQGRGGSAQIPAALSQCNLEKHTTIYISLSSELRIGFSTQSSRPRVRAFLLLFSFRRGGTHTTPRPRTSFLGALLTAAAATPILRLPSATSAQRSVTRPDAYPPRRLLAPHGSLSLPLSPSYLCIRPWCPGSASRSWIW